MTERLRILISAYACSPYKGSEPGVGWGFVSELAKFHDLWVIVEEEKFRADIEQYLNENPELGKHVRFYFIQKLRNRWLRKLWPPSYYWYYRRWHQDAYRLAQQLHTRVRFDLTHQLTMVGFREPGYLWKLGIPFVWGPIGGMGLFPWKFLPVMGMYGACYYLGYNLLNWLHTHFLERPRQAASSAASGFANGLITATPENRDGAVKYWGCASTVVTEVGLPREPLLQIRERMSGEPLRLVWTGSHTPGKALNIALLALSRVSVNVNWELHILGTGQQTSAWKKYAHKLGVSARCYFYGWMPREQALDVMQNAHGMLITSLRDLTSSVTVEALALGLPIVCLDHCGFAEVVDETCGVKIPVTTPSEVVVAIARAIEQLAQDEGKRQELARGALQRARHFSWEEKARLVDQIYRAKVGDPPLSRQMNHESAARA
ncbi:glycosyltransferase family 4 protein [Nitrosomonas sp. Nm166]|uniref:glycosyltransferase family 4 protein n=1 Tax=Nitrosomonas sp. Nm166 TaxID=1881054 RepID=UPI0008DFC21B|nr:glycosyltransferase [Nitrosomonas sp. Nm166]SFD91619.1 Glycosyltransferase involved in cell wall bisynthesis [Nitrosomonas sp. Nm166]